MLKYGLTPEEGDASRLLQINQTNTNNTNVEEVISSRRMCVTDVTKEKSMETNVLVFNNNN